MSHNMANKLRELPVSSTQVPDVIQEVDIYILVDEIDSLGNLMDAHYAAVMTLVIDEGLDRPPLGGYGR